ncbi:MAG TPA: class I SAM-dependent methyltransferase [Stellaceae bacterium]|nr:class I SAM-dependent methyltransferase [Stellaceae bacterium]
MWPFARKRGANRRMVRQPPPWPFAADPEAYKTAFRDSIRRIYMPNLPEELLASEIVQQDIEDHVCNRMITSLRTLVPWIAPHKVLQGSRILEIGCGTGSASAALAAQGAQLESLDINPAALDCARIRLDLLGMDERVRFHHLSADWTAGAREGHAGDPRFEMFGRRHDVVILVATLEHMTIDERIDCLTVAWSVLEEGGIMVTQLTPNRLFPFDWHTSREMFTQLLPVELAVRYAPRCKRADYAHAFSGVDVNHPSPADIELLYRWGRGISYHEFDLAIGLENLRVLDDGRNPLVARPYLDEIGFAGYVEKNFERFKLDVPRGFFLPSLDLILQKATR